MTFMEPTTLEGRVVRLIPLENAHVDGLTSAVRDGQLWNLWYTTAPAPDQVATLVTHQRTLATSHEVLPFAVQRTDGAIVGMTTFLHPLPAVPAVEIGATWLARSAQRTGINTEMKYLMLTHAFDVWGCHRVAFRTAWLNHQSRAAIERLGAVFEGRIRRDRVTRTGVVTDTAQYSITDTDWPAVKVHLSVLLGPHHGVRSSPRPCPAGVQDATTPDDDVRR